MSGRQLRAGWRGEFAKVKDRIKRAIQEELEHHAAIIEAMPDLHGISFTVYIHGEKTECVVEYRAQATRRSSL